MGGEVGVKSIKEVGSTFWFTIQLHESDLIVVDTHSSEPFKGIRALIVDDNSTNRMIFEHQLDAWGIAHTSAESGKAAIEEYAVSIKAGKPYEFILLDMMMPEMHGIEVAKILRQRYPTFTQNIIMLTSGFIEEYMDEGKAIGIEHFLNKPVRQSVLYDVIKAVALNHLDDTSNETTSETEKADLKPVQYDGKILIAEDNVVNQKVALGMLKKLGFSAVVVSNGGEAVRAIKGENFDVVLMDCHMPEMDGYEATNAIRLYEGNDKHTTIIALTANAMAGDREKCIAAGMDDYLPKPLDYEQMDEMLKKWLHLSENS